MSSQQQKVKGVVDVVFLVDVTGSMSHCIDALKGNIQAFVRTLTEGGGPNDPRPVVKDFRIKVVGYRDAVYDSNWFIEHPFTASVDEAAAHIGSLTAEGGGDLPESLLDALHKVCSMPQTMQGSPAEPNKWRFRHSATRVVVIFTDAPFHPTMSYPDGRGGGISDVVNVATTNRIIIEFFVPDMDCFAELEQIDGCNGHKIPFDSSKENGAALALQEFTKDTQSFSRVMVALAKSISVASYVPSL